MEINGKEKEILCLESDSYKIGKELGLFSQVWQNDRKNIKASVNQFNGRLSLSIKNLDSVIDRCNQLQERLIRNSAWFNRDAFDAAYNTFNEKFNKVYFIKGYYEGFCAFKSKEVLPEIETK